MGELHHFVCLSVWEKMTLDGGSISFRPGMVKAFSFVQSGKLARIALCHQMQPPIVVSVLI